MSASKLTVIIVYALGLAGLATIGSSFFNQLGCEGQLVDVPFTPPPEQQIWGEQVIGQSFIAPRSYLNRVDLLLQTYGRRNTHDVTFRLLEIPAGVDNPLQGLELFRTTFNAAAARDQQWYTFTFPTIAESAGKTYFVVLESPTSEPGDAITVGGINKDAYAPGLAFWKSTPVEADVAFRACFQMTVFEKLQVLSRQMTQNRPFLWGHINFYLVGLVIYLLLLIGFFWQLTRFVG